MSHTHHFLIIHCTRSGPALPIDEYRDRLTALKLRKSGAWHLHDFGTLVVGWLGDPIETGRPFFLFTGALVEPDSRAIQEPAFSRVLIENTMADSFPLDGTFAACAVDPENRQALVCNDHFGMAPLYQWEQDGCRVYSTSLRALTAVTQPACHLDVTAVYEMIDLHMVLGNRTFLKEITTVPPATVIRLTVQGTDVRRYWNWAGATRGAEATPTPKRDYVGETYEKIESAILRSVRGASKVAVTLSGGLDSRMIAAVLARHKVPIHLYNMDYGRESPIARAVADVLGVKLQVLPPHRDPTHIMFGGHDAVDCLYHVNQTWGWDLGEQAAKDGCDLTMDGLAFDTILGSVLRSEGSGPEALARGLMETFHNYDVVTLSRVVGKPLAEKIHEMIFASLLEQAGACIAEAGEWASECFVMTNRIRKYTFGWGLANMHYLPGAFPYVTRDLFEHCMRLPLELRLEHRLYRQIYRERFPELARIPWAKTGLPLDQYGVPPESSPWLSRLDALVRRLTWGRITFQGRGDLDAEFRRRADMQAPFLQCLLHPEPATLGHTLPATTVPDTLEQQRIGRNYVSFLQSLFTVENFLARMVRDGDVTLVQ